MNPGCWGSSPFTFVEGRNSSPPASLQADANKKVKVKCLDLQLDFRKDEQRNLFYLRSAACVYVWDWPQHVAEYPHGHSLTASAAGRGRTWEEQESEKIVRQNKGQ